MQSLQDDMRYNERRMSKDLKNIIEISGSYDFKQMKNLGGINGGGGLMKGNPNNNQSQLSNR